ncbi:MAG: tagaturonate epimerase family protein, partial [Cyclobacteriaceae bacterium]
IGDRFGCQGIYQLRAFQTLNDRGISVIPVWNKSNREHSNTGTKPESVMKEARSAVNELDWDKAFHVDADHITMETVSDYTDSSDFFTIDVAREISDPPVIKDPARYADLFLKQLPEERHKEFNRDMVTVWAAKYRGAAQEAGRIYSRIRELKGSDDFIAEVSMDEVEAPQTPDELFFIIFLLKDAGVRLQTIAPKFPGRFNKGIDYTGSVKDFEKNFEEYLRITSDAIRYFGLPETLKLSIHTGSDKFSLYPVMGSLIRKYHCGIHLKTAGTSWLEEVIGLAESGETAYVSDLYTQALSRFEELTGAYKDVIDIDFDKLPGAEDFSRLDGKSMAAVIRHDSSKPGYDRNVRQLMHTAYKIAAENKEELLKKIDSHHEKIGEGVYDNLLNKHLVPLFYES